jgi:hypothetical protein
VATASLPTGLACFPTHTTSDGAGSYRLAINPFAGTGWYIEVGALK